LDGTKSAKRKGGSGRILVVSGPSGSGNTTLVKRLLAEDPKLVWSVSATTRSPRPGEVDGKDYRFLSRADFEQGIRDGEFAEHAESFGQLYGTPAEPLRRALADGSVMLLDIDVQGARQIKRSFPGAYLVFVMAPSEEELLRRLTARGTEDEQSRKIRLDRVRQELAARNEYDTVVVNDDLDRAVAELKAIVSKLRGTSR
jgi:guanylate kinase